MTDLAIGFDSFAAATVQVSARTDIGRWFLSTLAGTVGDYYAPVGSIELSKDAALVVWKRAVAAGVRIS